MLKSDATESGSEADDEAGNGKVDGKEVEVMSEPPDPIDTTNFDPPVLCCGLAICQYVRLMFQSLLCLAIIVMLGLTVVFSVDLSFHASSCGDLPLVTNTSMAGEVVMASCVKLQSLVKHILNDNW